MNICVLGFVRIVWNRLVLYFVSTANCYGNVIGVTNLVNSCARTTRRRF